MPKTKIKRAAFAICLGMLFLRADVHAGGIPLATDETPITTEKTPVTIHFFHTKMCPHCYDEQKFLQKLVQQQKFIIVKAYELTTSTQNARLFAEVSKFSGEDIASVPLTIIGNKYVSGYYSDETHGAQIEKLAMDGAVAAQNSPNADAVSTVLNYFTDIHPEVETWPADQTTDPTQATKPQTPEIDKGNGIVLKLPIIGKIDTQKLSLPALTFVIALLDGFNPCAMWVLLFLISLLLGMKNRKKMWVLGTVFILTSGFVYFLFLSAWLNFFLLIGYATAVRYGIGFLALGIGIYYTRGFIKNKEGGCDVMKSEKRQKIFEKLREVALNQNFFLAILGIIALAFAVNVVELLCSAGLPAVYTKTLSMASLSTWQYYSYLIFYVLIFMLDDLFVFVIAMVTLKAVGVESKYARYSHLLGGIIMFLIGVLMLFKPEILI